MNIGRAIAIFNEFDLPSLEKRINTFLSNVESNGGSIISVEIKPDHYGEDLGYLATVFYEVGK